MLSTLSAAASPVALAPQLPHQGAHEVRRPAPVEHQRKRQLTERDDGQPPPLAVAPRPFRRR